MSTRPPTTLSAKASDAWWQREDLAYFDGQLCLAGERLDHLASSAQKPVFAYSAPRIEANLDRLQQAMRVIPHPTRILYAMKANRFLPLLSFLRMRGIDGIDVCSPTEIRQARQVGFREDQISFTGTSVSDADLDCLALHPDVWVNCDSLSMIRRLGDRSPGRKVGLRINAQIGVGYRENNQLHYAGASATKFGIYLDRMEEALNLAAASNLEVSGIHFHAGCGYLDEQLPVFRKVIEGALPFLRMVPQLEHLNLGGGLGVPIVDEDSPLDLSAWCDIVGSTLGDVATSIWVEPGDFIVKDAGVLVLEVNTVEEKGGQLFVGVNGGFNLHIEPAFYDLPLHIVPCTRNATTEDSALRNVTIAGNINEALDIFARDVALLDVREGDRLAFLNAGGYGSSMSSNHCMRGDFAEYLIF